MPYYFDNNATTPLDPRVHADMQEELSLLPENPSSVTSYGRRAKQKLISCRNTVSECLNMRPHEIIFNSGGTEGNNCLLHSFSHYCPNGLIIVSSLDHASILKPAEHLKRTVYKLKSNETGIPSIEELQHLLETQSVAFVMLMAVNNETGVHLPLEEFSDLCKRYHVPLVLDMVALLGKEALEIPAGVVAASFSAHKLHGPKGSGFIWCRRPEILTPFIQGGAQEHNLRGGTENLLGIVGLTSAVKYLNDTMPNYLRQLQNHFELSLFTSLPHLSINGTATRISNTSNVHFPDISGETLLMQLDQKGVIASMGSACQANAIEPSHVLLAMGHSYTHAQSSLRFSFSRFNTVHEIDDVLHILFSLLENKALVNK